MTLNPQQKIADGVGEPYPGQTVDVVEAIRARHAAQDAAERERLAALDVLAENPEPVWQRLASWLG